MKAFSFPALNTPDREGLSQEKSVTRATITEEKRALPIKTQTCSTEKLKADISHRWSRRLIDE